MTASVAGPEMLIRVSNTIPFASETYQHCLNGNVPGLVRLFEIGSASPFDLDPDGVSLLSNALKLDLFNVCRLLISQGSDLYQEDHTGFSAYHVAWDGILFDPLDARASKRKQALLELFPQDEGGLDERQFSRIHKCVLGIVGTKLEDELNISTSTIDDVDNLGRTPLYWAARRGDAYAVKLLLEYGAQCEPPNLRKDGHPLLAAAKTGNEEIVRLLLAHNAKVTARGEDQLTALHHASTASCGTDCVKLLLEAGADANCGDNENRTPFHYATQYDLIETAEVLLAVGADINALCEDGWTPIACCVFWNMHLSIEMLLHRGADTLVKTEPGEPLLHLAARYGDEATLKMLARFDLGPLDVEAKTAAGEDVYRIGRDRDETPEWNAAFDEFVRSIGRSMQRETNGTHGGEAAVDMVSYATIKDSLKDGIVVKVEELSDEDSDSGHFEDALQEWVS